ncbi:MAG: type I 3-dehydroquinate dehydratase [Candidatus Thalassarchaeaceae archaeon]|nr:type I 3-dehydroquinate dehydratase [Candidatus Thalassarchaeaceae archaeon]
MTDTEICVSLRGHSVGDMIRDASRATAAGADLVEVRFDNLYVNRIEIDPIVTKNAKGEETVEKQPPIMEKRPIEDIEVEPSIQRLKDGIQIPVIFACRSTSEGGHFHGDEDARMSILNAAIASGVTWVDLEISIASKARKALVKACGEETSIIASSHLPAASSSDEIVEFVNANSDAGSIIKCCYLNVDHARSLHIFEAAHTLKEGDAKVALMGNGPGGDWTRIHAPLLEQALVYTTLDRDYSLVKQGLVNITDLRTAWGVLEYE